MHLLLPPYMMQKYNLCVRARLEGSLSVNTQEIISSIQSIMNRGLEAIYALWIILSLCIAKNLHESFSP